jgi:outer membrane protein OmpA-like peptidoglycan-associated protein
VRVDGQLNEIRGIGVDARTGPTRRSAGPMGDARDPGPGTASSAQVQQADITFDTGKADVSASDRAVLAGLLKVLNDNPTYTADVVGYTDSVGPADDNVSLSWRRAEAVRRFMMERGADLNRFYFVGLGEELSGDDTKDAQKRAKNRRVTVTIFKPVD